MCHYPPRMQRPFRFEPNCVDQTGHLCCTSVFFSVISLMALVLPCDSMQWLIFSREVLRATTYPVTPTIEILRCKPPFYVGCSWNELAKAAGHNVSRRPTMNGVGKMAKSYSSSSCVAKELRQPSTWTGTHHTPTASL